MTAKLRPKSAKDSRQSINYHERYGGPCPYKPIPPRPQSGVEQNREFVNIFSKGISPTSHYDIILGPKRPASAVVGRSSYYREKERTVDPIVDDHAKAICDDLTEEDEKILSIRVALVKARTKHDEAMQQAHFEQKYHVSVVCSNSEEKESACTNKGVHYEALDPILDKDYLQPRPPPKALSPRPVPSSPRPGASGAGLGFPVQPVPSVLPPRPNKEKPHPELQRRSLFVCGVRDAVSAAHSQVSNDSSTKKTKKPTSEKQQKGLKSLQKSPGKKQLTPPKTQLRRGLSASMGPEASDGSQASGRNKYIRQQSSTEHTKTEANDPLYQQHTVVEARFRGRSQWRIGTIVVRNSDGTYDIQYGDILERRVNPSLIRPKSTVDVDRMKKKILLSGFVSMAATEGLLLSGSFQRSAEERKAATAEQNETPEETKRSRSVLNVMDGINTEVPTLDDVTETLSPTYLMPNRERKTMVRGTIMKLASGGDHSQALVVTGSPLVPTTIAERTVTGATDGNNLSPSTGEALSDSVGSPIARPPPFRPNFLGGLMAQGGIGGLRKVQRPELNDEVAREAEESAKKAKEKSEQLRLWPELVKIAAKEKNEIAFEDVHIVREIGRGKFASVHKAEMRMKIHQKVFGTKEAAKRTFERLGNNLNKMTGDEQLVVSAAVKVLEYSQAYPLVGGDWERDKPAEVEYLDDTTYTDGENGDRYQETRSRSSTDADMLRGSYADKYEIYPPSKCLLEALREVRALVHLHHSNIVILHGMVMKPRLMLVMECMHCSLYDALNTAPENLQVALTPAQRIHILTGVASGVAYMHTMRFIHRDLKVHNILLSVGMGGFVAKLADFGTSLPMPTRQLLTESVGTSGYTAPEVMTGEGYDVSADVFSLGILQWETLQPFDKKLPNPLCGKDPEHAAEEICEGVRPSLEFCLVPAVKDLVERSWATDADHRPSASEVLTAYEQLVVGQEPD